MNTHHYFASTAYVWAVGATREEAVSRVTRNLGAALIRRCGDLRCRTFRVELPIEAAYSIESHIPYRTQDGKPVPLSDPITYELRSVRRKIEVPK